MDEADKQVEKKSESNVGKSIKHKGFADGSIVQKYVQYAYDIGWMDLVLLIECENGNWNLYQQSTVVKDWKREDSWGLCQVHRPDHKEIVDNPLFRSNYKWQLDRCKELMESWTLFFWRDREINWQKCSNYVKDRFLIQ